RPQRRNGVWDISPVRREEADKENDIPVLSLIQFSKAPFVSFGAVKLGTSKSAVLRIENPNEDVEAVVIVEKIASNKGFSVDYSTFTIEVSCNLTITWTPVEEGGVRELIIFNANGVVKHQAVLLGRAEAPKRKKVRQTFIATISKTQPRAYRLRKSRKMERENHAAKVIQGAFRKWHEKKTSEKVAAAVKIQAWYRMQVCLHQYRKIKVSMKDSYLALRNATVKIQATWRGRKVRKRLDKENRCATIIQAWFHRYVAQKQYTATKASTLVIQQHFRRYMAMKTTRKAFLDIQAAVAIQAAYRGLKVRKEVFKSHRAATVIQSAFRKYKEQVKYQAMRLSAIIIQRYYRSWVLQKQERNKFLKLKHSAILIQAVFRGHCARKDIAKMQKAATIIQANFRMHKRRTDFKKQQRAACVLQQRFRAQKEMNCDLLRYQRQKRASVVIQAAYRGMKSRQQVKRMHQAACVIQRSYKTHCERKWYQALKNSTLTIQRRYRATIVAKRQMQCYQRKRRAAVLLQAVFRGHRARKELANRTKAALVIQSNFRRYREEMKYQALRLAAVIIQRRYRALVTGHKARQRLSRMHRAATVIQANFRKHKEESVFKKQRWAACLIQQKFRAQRRMKFEMDNYQKQKEAVVVLQAAYRGLKARQSVKRMHKAASVVQLTYKTYCQRKKYLALKAAVVAIQKRYQFERMREAALFIQAAYRGLKVRKEVSQSHHAATVIQSAFRRHKHEVVYQALWRGYRSRCLNDNAKVVKLRQRLKKVTAGVREEDKLCNKTSTALDYLLRYKHFSYILEALKNLETATRLSPECCERLVESGATKVIFTLIRCCNRSVPCMEVITYSIQILLNLSKYHETIEAVYSVESSVDTLLELLQRYREKAGDKVAEKGGSIFTKACFLLALLLQDKRRALEVTKIPKAVDRLQSIYRLTARKHKMDADRTVTKQKMNASINGSFYIQATPRKTRPAPKFAPEWVLTKNKLKDIVDPLRAIQMVAETLSIIL
uniref:Abnormal spindle-like microcephaly-associated protein ASH domain-containing protein n=1 Tax=Periophthalmus magnuspinnatus TaxID=409849 RepID=A0A3B4BKW6_9GOBI